MSKKRRSQVKNPALKKGYNSKVRQEHIDYDYVDKLSEEEKELLNKFTSEYYGADLDFKNLRKNLHRNKRLKKDCTDRNNKQNNDMFGVARAQNRLEYINAPQYITNENEAVNTERPRSNKIESDIDVEDAIIEYIDSKKLEE